MNSSKPTAAKRAKKAPAFVPTFEGPIEGYVVNSLRTNFFRVERSMTREDYMQEAYLVFLRVRDKYAAEVTEPAHMMALFKRAWFNELNDLANRDTALRALVSAEQSQPDGGAVNLVEETVGELRNEGELAVLLAQAPREVSMVLNLFLSASPEMLQRCLKDWNGKDRRCKAGGSATINRLLGLDPDIDVMQRVEDYFTAALS